MTGVERARGATSISETHPAAMHPAAMLTPRTREESRPPLRIPPTMGPEPTTTEPSVKRETAR
jgi:hypothetical protein